MVEAPGNSINEGERREIERGLDELERAWDKIGVRDFQERVDALKEKILDIEERGLTGSAGNLTDHWRERIRGIGRRIIESVADTCDAPVEILEGDAGLDDGDDEK